MKMDTILHLIPLSCTSKVSATKILSIRVYYGPNATKNHCNKP